MRQASLQWLFYFNHISVLTISLLLELYSETDEKDQISIP